MEKVGVFIELDDQGVKRANNGALTFADPGNNQVLALVMGEDASPHKEALEAFGASQIAEIKTDAGHIPWHPEVRAHALALAVRHFGLSALVGLTTPMGREVLPRVAALLDTPLVMDCLDADLGGRVVKKSRFSGKVVCDVKLEGDVAVIGVRPNAKPEKPLKKKAEIIAFEVNPPQPALRMKKRIQSKAAGVDLSEAQIIISGGRCMGSTENYAVLEKCAKVMGGAVGASRAAVDAGYVPHSMQVGQTGTTVSPNLYVACGISGAIQHLAGMKTSGLVVAVNTDPKATIFQHCDYGIVGDLFEIVPILTRELETRLEKRRQT